MLELTRLGVATRPGYPEGRIQSVLDRLDHPERVEFFEIEPHPVASRDLRERLRGVRAWTASSRRASRS